MAEEVRLAEEAQRNAEAVRHRLETELREMAVRLEQAEHVALREGKRIVAKLQNRVRQLLGLVKGIKVKAFYARYRALGPELIPLYSQDD